MATKAEIDKRIRLENEIEARIIGQITQAEREAYLEIRLYRKLPHAQREAYIKAYFTEKD